MWTRSILDCFNFMVFLAAWYKAERIHCFFFRERRCFLIYCTDFIDVKFGLIWGDEAEGLLDEKCFPSPKKRADMSKALLSPSLAEFLLLYKFLLPRCCRVLSPRRTVFLYTCIQSTLGIPCPCVLLVTTQQRCPSSPSTPTTVAVPKGRHSLPI